MKNKSPSKSRLQDGEVKEKKKKSKSSRSLASRKASKRKTTLPKSNDETTNMLALSIADNGNNIYTSSYNEEEDEYETEGEGRDYERFYDSSFQPVSESQVLQEKEAVLKLCTQMAEHFWESAWTICAERFYNGNAPSAIALELRDTWLRITEAQYLDQDQSLTANLPPNLLVPDEPPPLLISSSLSTEEIIRARQRPPKKSQERETKETGQGDTAEKTKSSGRQKSHKNKVKGSSTKSKRGKSVRGLKSSKSAMSTKRSARGVGKQDGNKKNKKSNSKDEVCLLDPPACGQIAAPNTHDSLPGDGEEEEMDEVARAIAASGCVERPAEEQQEEDTEVPWDVIFESKHLCDEEPVSRSASHEYRALGLEPWSPSQSPISGSGVFRFINETRSFVKKHSQMLQQLQEKKSREPLKGSSGGESDETPPEPGQKSDEIPFDSSAATERTDKVFSLKAASVIIEVPINESQNSKVGASSTSSSSKKPTVIMERIDNLLHADSDHVVDILKPAEVVQMASRSTSQEFNVQESEFDKHFPKRPDGKDERDPRSEDRRKSILSSRRESSKMDRKLLEKKPVGKGNTKKSLAKPTTTSKGNNKSSPALSAEGDGRRKSVTTKRRHSIKPV